MKPRSRIPKRRNPMHGHPLLRKGGAHEKSKSAQRHKVKVALRKGQWPDQVLQPKAAPDQVTV